METHTKKHVLGFVGLAAVAAMTAVAYSIPTPDAAAVGPTSTNVTYSVEVHEKASVVFADDLDGATFVTSPVSIKANYGETTKLNYYLTYTDANGNEVTELLVRSICPGGDCSGSPQYLTGADEFTLDVGSYGGYGTYKLHVVAEGTNVTSEDYATFKYSAGSPANQGTDENGNPIIDIKVNDDVDHACIQVYDLDGNPLFIEENGTQVPFCVKTDGSGHIVTPLPFDKYNIPNGEYDIEITLYDANGNILDVIRFRYNYGAADQRKELAVPDTGFLGLGSLNLVKADFWIAGLAILTAVTGGAYYLTKRAKSRR